MTDFIVDSIFGRTPALGLHGRLEREDMNFPAGEEVSALVDDYVRVSGHCRVLSADVVSELASVDRRS